MSQLKTEMSNLKIAHQNKVNELMSKIDAQAKDNSLLEVQDRKRLEFSEKS